MSKLISYEDIKNNQTTDKKYLAIGGNGQTYNASWDANLKVMFFCIPYDVNVLGYQEV